jgi:hypothetical protein
MADTATLLLSKVKVGVRLREDMGDIAALAESINAYGLLHPIVLDDDDNLVAGQRRLEACKNLGWKDVPIRRLGELTIAERHVIELEENLRRKDLTKLEQARLNIALDETAGEVLREKVKEVSRQPAAKGRPPDADSERAREKETGIPAREVRRSKQIVDTIGTLPFLNDDQWKQQDVVKAGKLLDKIPDPDRGEVVVLLNTNRRGMPSKNALSILRNLSNAKPKARARIIALSKSDDERDRDRALTDAAGLAPEPDPRAVRLVDVERTCKWALGLYPNDPSNSAIRAALVAVQRAIKVIDKNNLRR